MSARFPPTHNCTLFITPLLVLSTSDTYKTNTQLLRTALLIDIGLPVPAFLPHSSIPESVPVEVS